MQFTQISFLQVILHGRKVAVVLPFTKIIRSKIQKIVSGGTWQRTFKMHVYNLLSVFLIVQLLLILKREEREQMCLPKEAVVSFKIFFCTTIKISCCDEAHYPFDGNAHTWAMKGGRAKKRILSQL